MLLHHSDLIIIRGAPGVGKSSLGRRLTKAIPTGFVVEVDNIRAMINSPNKWVSKNDYINSLNSAEQLVKSYLTSGYKPAIVIDTFDQPVLSSFCNMFQHYILTIVTLYADNNILENRLQHREKGFKDWNITKLMNEQVLGQKNEAGIWIDTSDLNKDEVLESLI